MQPKSRGLFLLSFVLIVSIASCMFAGCSSGSNNADANLQAQAEPSNGAILTGSSNGNAGVRVTAAPGESAYVKVKSAYGGTAVGFFVRSGSTAEALVPAGNYSVQFASGETWYGSSDCFGSRTSYGQDPNVSLGPGDVITYSLQQSTTGNFHMNSLNGSDF